MEHTLLLDTDKALAPMLEMAEQSSDDKSTIRTLVMKVLSSPTVFCGFDQIKASLGLGDDDVLGRTLDLFSYGVFHDYKTAAEADKYLNLTNAQLFKLRQLTVQSLSQTACLEGSATVAYDTLAQALELQEDVEDVVVSCIYARTIRGTLCQQTKQLILSSQAGPPIRSRDVHPSQTKILLVHLSNMSQKLEATLVSLDEQQSVVAKKKEGHEAFWRNNKPREHNNKDQNMGGFGGMRFGRDRPRATKRSRGGLASADGSGGVGRL